MNIDVCRYHDTRRLLLGTELSRNEIYDNEASHDPRKHMFNIES